MNLSKSRFCKGIQCPKILWMDLNKREEFDKSVVNEKVLETGDEVGDLAMHYFGEYTEVTFLKDNKPEMIAETKRLLDEGTAVIAEASFSHEGNFCMVDILRKTSFGYELIEVKSSTGSVGEGPEDIKDIYLYDMAFQYYVLSACGIDVCKVSLMQLNHNYVRKGDLDLQELFVLTDCTDTILDMQPDIPDQIAQIVEIATQETEPDPANAKIGSRCSKPYECGYKRWCFRNLPKPGVFDIGWSMWSRKKDSLYQAGFLSFEDVLGSGEKLLWKQERQIRAAVEGSPPHIDKEQIRKFLSSVRYPLYHLDFETYQQAIPQWDNLSPYRQITFQYSLHIQSEAHAEPEHKEFLAKAGEDRRREFAERLCADIPKDVCVLSYNMGFEKGRIREVAEIFEDLSEHLMSINGNMIDLAVPFSSGAYYAREMGGSYSLKAVVPALFPNDPELDYNALSIVKNGGDAMNIYPILHEKPEDEAEKIRKALLAYCRLDTLVMVKILDYLHEVAG